MKKITIKCMTLCILLLLAVGLAGCEEEDENDTFLYPVNANEQVSSFFDNISKEYYWKQRGFFNDTLEDEDMCIIINSDEELRSAYSGEGQLPSIDFKQYSLVLGKVFVDISWNLKEQRLELDGKNALLHLYFERPTEATIDQMIQHFYWGLYKKNSARIIKTKKYYDNKIF